MRWLIDRIKQSQYPHLMFGISGEHLLILGIVLLLFGPRRLPELGNTLGKAIKNFKDAVSGVEEAKYRHLDPANNSQIPPNPSATASSAQPVPPSQNSSGPTASPPPPSAPSA